MSRLDIVTIGIVALCVTALAVLIYRVVKLTGNNDAEVAVSEAGDEYDQYFNDESADDTYTFDDEGEVVSEDSAEDAIPASATNDEVISEPVAEEESTEEEIADEPLAEEEEQADLQPEEYDENVELGSNEGDYMVIAGTFGDKTNADVLVKKLQDAGYTNAGSHLFDRKKYNVVIADRYEELSQAKAAARMLKKEHGIAAYVKRK